MLLFLDLSHDEAKSAGKLRTVADLNEAILHGAVKRARPKIGGLVTSFVLGLLVYPGIYKNGNSGSSGIRPTRAPRRPPALPAQRRSQPPGREKEGTMNKKLYPTLVLTAALSLAVAPTAGAMNCGSHGAAPAAAADHGAMAGMHGEAPSAGKRPRPGVEIRTTVVAGHAVSYNLIDMQEMMKGPMAKMMTHEGGKMKTHHLMVYAATPEGKPAIDGKAGFLVVLPDKSEVKLMAMQMMEGFGGDVDLVAQGDYKITTKIALGSTTLVDEFVYTVKPSAAATAALVNATCPISGGVVGADGIPENLTRVHKGQKIGFCCDGCPAEWDKLTDAEKAARLAKTRKPGK